MHTAQRLAAMQHEVATATARLASLGRRLIASDHLALRLAASAILVGVVVLMVWWAMGIFATL